MEQPGMPTNTEVPAIVGFNRMGYGDPFGLVCNKVTGIPPAPPSGKSIRHCLSHTYYNKIYGKRHGRQPCLFPHCCQSC